jgi:predicted DNA binding CopG/RHH family protein
MSSGSSLRARPRTRKPGIAEVNKVKAEFDLSKMKSRRNPFASKLKKSVTMRLSEDVVQYFKAMAAQAGVPCQSLIDLYLRDCLAQNRKVDIKWPRVA